MLALSGEVDLAAARPISDALRRAGDGRARLVILDLTAVTFLDRACAALLHRAHARAQAAGWTLLALAPPAPAARLFNIIMGEPGPGVRRPRSRPAA